MILPKSLNPLAVRSTVPNMMSRCVGCRFVLPYPIKRLWIQEGKHERARFRPAGRNPASKAAFQCIHKRLHRQRRIPLSPIINQDICLDLLNDRR